MHSPARGRIVFLWVFITLIFFAAITQDVESGSNLIYIKNSSSSGAKLQINDEVCKQSNDVECDNARTILLNQECLQNPISPACNAARSTVDSKCGCVQARNTLSSVNCTKNSFAPECSEAQSKIASSSCQEGLIFEGTIESGVKIPLTICLSPAGYGHVSVKDIRNSVWKSYHLISPGDTLSYP